MGSPNDDFSITKSITTLDVVPGKKILESLGIIQYTRKGIKGDITKSILNDLFECLLSHAINSGANHVINTKVVTGSYQQQGSALVVTYITVYGDAVRVSA